MLFNSLNFAVFLPVVFLLYWFGAKKSRKLQNGIFLVASYFFYSCWDWRFLFLLVFSTVLDYYTGLKMQETKEQAGRKFWLYLSVTINLGFLAIFKYYNFFAESFGDAVSTFGFKANPSTLNIILPIGISFYTFHGLSYVIDVYKNRITAEQNFVDYACFVSFFPLLVAGPIERATHLLPQLKKARSFDYAKAADGLRQILWGLFKKIVIADNCAEFADKVFNHPGNHSGSTLALGAMFFAFQIYADFSGYSDIALGTARLFGIDLLKNFAFPYFSRDIAEFWRRWHISLSSWFRDYLYIPLGGSRGSTTMKIRNIFIVFVISGFWHGANWTFIVWGTLHALYFLPLLLTNRNRSHLDIAGQGKMLPSIKELMQISLTFCLTTFAWIFFRAQTVGQAGNYISGIFSKSVFTIPSGADFSGTTLHPFKILSITAIFFVAEWLGRERHYALENVGLNWKKQYRYAMYYLIVIALILFKTNGKEFIYFQF